VDFPHHLLQAGENMLILTPGTELDWL